MGDQPMGMAMLRDKIADIAALIPRDRPVVFLDYPVYLNVGDLLIEKATDAFFRHFGYHVTEIRSAHDFPPAHGASVAPDATIVFQGGGNFGDLYDLHQKFREQIVGRYRRNRIVLLPQTIYFESRARLDACVEVFGAHPDLHVCVRDRGSYAFFQKHFPNPVYLFPDMAHFLWDDFRSHRRSEPRRATLLFLRADKEECPFVYQDAVGLKPIDWRDIINGMDRAALSVLLRWHERHDRILPRVGIYPFWRLFREHMTGKAVRLVSDYDLVVTNRLHMALLGVLMGRKVAMADNSYGKLSAYHSCWLQDIASVEMFSAREPAAQPPALAPVAI